MKLILLAAAFLLAAISQLAHLANFLPSQKVYVSMEQQNRPDEPIKIQEDLMPTRTTTAAQFNQTSSTRLPDLVTSTVASSVPPTTFTRPETTTDPNAELDELPALSTPPGGQPTAESPTSGGGPNNGQIPDKTTPNKSQQVPLVPFVANQMATSTSSVELNVLFYSIFIVLVSFVKLIYHNVAMIRRTLTEPGILMIFGILWELSARQLSSNHDLFPRFNSRIFFYLFLPSTVLEAASLLSNKWLFLNMLSIMIHSIVGTLLYASSLGFTIYSLSRQNLFQYVNLSQTYTIQPKSIEQQIEVVSSMQLDNLSGYELLDKSYLSDRTFVSEISNLTLADCLVFGTILSSIDSTSMLGAFKLQQVNEKLYYLLLGENLMNNAVVLVVFNILIDFFNATRLTVVKIYIAVIQFFITLIGSVFIGLILAAVALLSVGLIKRLQVPGALSSYQNQCHAMVETLLIIKLAYLSYTLASMAGTSSILTFRQVILATRTMGYSLVYPLLGMLLVEVADSGRLFHTWLASQKNIGPEGSPTTAAISSAASKLSQLADQANLYWNFKFLSIVLVITLVYRFAVVIILSLICNLLSSRQLKVRFKDQILMAYGGLKGPLAFAMVSRLIEHEEYKDRTMRNKHLFMYTILFITFASTLIKGAFIRPLVSKIQLSVGSMQVKHTTSRDSTLIFAEVNSKVTEYVAHGLNSILGQSKSPYDRFAELNETLIKPWLARDGSNTNWLSIFYDNLVLDETLNANCFYRSTDSLINAQVHPMTPNSRPPSARARRTQSSQHLTPLRTISENQPAGSSPVEAQAPKVLQFDKSTPNNNSLLKEFVMFDLKLEDAKRAPRQHSLDRRIKGRTESRPNSGGLSRPARVIRMLSSTSESDGFPSVLNREDKQKHLLNLEQQLEKSAQRRKRKPRARNTLTNPRQDPVTGWSSQAMVPSTRENPPAAAFAAGISKLTYEGVTGATYERQLRSRKL